MTVLNAAPQGVLNGIRDVSGVTPDPVELIVPIHMPHVLFLGARGPEYAQVMDPSQFTRIYGADSVDYRKPYAKHTTAMLKECFMPNANQFVAQRLIPATAKKATRRFWADVLETTVPVYERAADGSLVLDQAGEPVETGATQPGLLIKWVATEIDGDIGAAKKKTGSQTAGAKQSEMYPMFDMEISHYGVYGDNVGIRLYAPTLYSAPAVNETVVNDLRARLYRLSFMERQDSRSTPNLLRGLDDQTYVDFGLKPDMYHDATDFDYSAAEVIVPSFRELEPQDGTAPIYGPVEHFHIYQENIDLITALAFSKEQVPAGLADGDEYLLNIISGHDVEGNPHHAVKVLDIFDGGLSFNDQSVHYAIGGDDGDLSDANFDEMCFNQFQNYGDLADQFLDIARFPQSVVYDSGFSMKTKKAMANILRARKDIWVCVATQDQAQPQNTQEIESSTAVALRSQFEMFPESELHGTSVCRAAIVGQSGYLINSQYKKLVPATFELAAKLSAWAGSADGILKGRWSPDIDPNNRVKMLKQMNCTFKNARVRNKDWANGLVWFQSYDHRSNFCPAMQTVYKDDTSVLNSLLNVIICVEIEKVCHRVWRKFTGRTMSNAQLEQESDREILRLTNGRFDERVTIIPETHHTKADEKNGYSNSCNVHAYFDNMKTVTNFTVVSHRREELAEV